MGAPGYPHLMTDASESPGVVLRLSAGERTTWTVTETIRKIYVA